MDDTVLFLSAYRNVEDVKHRHLRNKTPKLKGLLKKYHFNYVLIGESFLCNKGVLTLHTEYDYVRQCTSYSFEPNDESRNIDEFKDALALADGCMKLLHAQSMLSDLSYLKIRCFIGLEQFSVSIGDHLYQIDPMAFCMENTWFIVFEVADFETKKPLSKDEILGKTGNFNLLRVNQYQYGKEEKADLADEGSTISQIIYQNVTNFFSELSQKSLVSEGDYCIFDTIVLSNNVYDVEQYLCSLIATKKLPSPLVDISSTQNYHYYPQDGVALITEIDEEAIDFARFNVIQLEAIKLYIFLSQIINNEHISRLNKVIRNNLYLENLFFAPNVPIETHQLLNFIHQTTSYQHHKKAIELKISYMSAQNELKKNHNSLLLNILLYVIALIGAIDSLDTISRNFGVPYVPSFFIVVVGFLALGIWWLITEIRREK